MTETMPAFGAERNLQIAELLGWTGLYLAQSQRTPGGAWGNDPADAPGVGGQRVACNFLRSAVPNYCGDNGDCFGLLVTLQKLPVVREIALRYIDETVCVKISTDLLNYSDGWTYDACEQSTLPGECGWRDAITQAAWEALSAAKETE